MSGRLNLRLRRDPVPQPLVEQVEQALRSVEAARRQARSAVADGASLAWRREAEATVDSAYREADRLLREATRIARAHSYHAWMAWRSRLSWLDQQRQQHLFEVADRPAMLPIGSIRAVDSGMTRPLIGERAHGSSKPAGSPAHYGLDLEEALRRTDALLSAAARRAERAGAPTAGAAAERLSRESAAARSEGPAPGSAPTDLPPAA